MKFPPSILDIDPFARFMLISLTVTKRPVPQLLVHKETGLLFWGEIELVRPDPDILAVSRPPTTRLPSVFPFVPVKPQNMENDLEAISPRFDRAVKKVELDPRPRELSKRSFRFKPFSFSGKPMGYVERFRAPKVKVSEPY